MLDAYAPPGTEPSSPSGYRSLRIVTWLLVGTMGGAVVFRALATASEGLIYVVDPVAIIDPDRASGLGLALGLLLLFAALAWIGLALAGVPMWVYWHWRAATNLRSLGRTALSDTPGWHAGWWFVPIANLWKPYYAMKELYKASLADDDDWYIAAVPALFQIWWACWIFGNIASSASNSLDRLGAYQGSLYAAATGAVLGGAASLLYLAWVVRIHRAQARLHAARAG